jgi:hypothetical protein
LPKLKRWHIVRKRIIVTWLVKSHLESVTTSRRALYEPEDCLAAFVGVVVVAVEVGKGSPLLGRDGDVDSGDSTKAVEALLDSAGTFVGTFGDWDLSNHRVASTPVGAVGRSEPL